MAKRKHESRLGRRAAFGLSERPLTCGDWELEELSDLLRQCGQKYYSAKEVIYLEGDRAGTVYGIRSGLVKILSYLPDGRARIVRLHGVGSWIGLSALLGRPYEHTAVAVDAVEAYKISASRLLVLRLNEPLHFFNFMEQWYEHLQEADLWIAEFSTGAIKSRVARLIRFLSDIEYGKSSVMVELLRVHEMADILGVTPESVSRILAEFKRVDILHKLEDPAHDLYQLDDQALHHLAGY